MKLLTITLLMLLAAICYAAVREDVRRSNRRDVRRSARRDVRRSNRRDVRRSVSRRGLSKKKKIDPDVQALVTKMFKEDKNRVKYGEDFELCYQGETHGYNDDEAKGPLICKLDPKILEKPTFKALHSLFDNYQRVEGKPENITQEEIDENNKFLDLVLASDAMQGAHALLVKKGKASSDPAEFKKKLYTLWFGPYGRKQKSHILDSSGFEHVFMGEINGRKHNIGGFHNWLHLYNEEKSGSLNYMGYLKKSQNPLIFNFRFKWYGTLKPLGSSFFGTSPEFELSLYSTIYMMGYSHATVYIDGVKVHITCYPINHNHNIGTCYPSIL